MQACEPQAAGKAGSPCCGRAVRPGSASGLEGGSLCLARRAFSSSRWASAQDFGSSWTAVLVISQALGMSKCSSFSFTELLLRNGPRPGGDLPVLQELTSPETDRTAKGACVVGGRTNVRV